MFAKYVLAPCSLNYYGRVVLNLPSPRGRNNVQKFACGELFLKLSFHLILKLKEKKKRKFFSQLLKFIKYIYCMHFNSACLYLPF